MSLNIGREPRGVAPRLASMKTRMLLLAAAALAAACSDPSTQQSGLEPVDSSAGAGAARDGYASTTPDSVAAEESGRASAATGASDPGSNDAAGGEASGSTTQN